MLSRVCTRITVALVFQTLSGKPLRRSHALFRAVRSLGVTRDSRVSREDRSWLIGQEHATLESRSPRVQSG